MEFKQLNYFLRIAAEGSLGAASRSLGIAQPALGRHVQALEKELGVQLFRRVPKGMELTDGGRYLKDHLLDPVELIQFTLRNVRSFPNLIDASLSLGLPHEVARILGGRLIEGFQRELPSLRLRIIESDSAKLADCLLQRTIDIALLVATIPAEQIYHFPIVSEPLFLAVPRASALASAATVKFEELGELPMILPSAQNALRIIVEKAALAAATELKTVLEIDSEEITKQAVRRNVGYGILPLTAFKREVDQGELVPIRIDELGLEWVTHWAIRPLWPVTRTIYDIVEKTIFQEWHAAVSSGEWPAQWLFDMSTLGQALTRLR